jgi:hypothetical protein
MIASNNLFLLSVIVNNALTQFSILWLVSHKFVDFFNIFFKIVVNLILTTLIYLSLRSLGRITEIA